MKRDTFFASHNYQELAQNMDAVLRADATRPRMGVVVGAFGSGKTKAVIRWAGANRSKYVRALGEWRKRPLWLLHDLGAELGDDVRQWQSTERMFREVEEKMKDFPGIIFFDEAEYIVSCPRLMALVRDLYDVSGAPVVLVGGLPVISGLSNFEAAASRTLKRVDFTDLSVDELVMFCEWRSRIRLAADGAVALHAMTAGNFRLLDVALDALEHRRDQNPETIFNAKVVGLAQPAITRAVREAQEIVRKAT